MRVTLLMLFLFVAAPAGPVQADDARPKTPEFQPLPEPPPPAMDYAPQAPAGPDTADTPRDVTPDPEPEITITTRGDTRYEEYRIAGQLYMIKVIPARGKPYYLIDHEGKGDFTRSDFAPRVSVPMWVIKRF
jgi:hypothetical protein